MGKCDNTLYACAIRVRRQYGIELREVLAPHSPFLPTSEVVQVKCEEPNYSGTPPAGITGARSADRPAPTGGMSAGVPNLYGLQKEDKPNQIIICPSLGGKDYKINLLPPRAKFL